MVRKRNWKSFSLLSDALIASAVGLALLLTVAAQAKGPERLGPRDDWDAQPCRMQRIPDPEGHLDYFGYAAAIDGEVAVAYGNQHIHVFRFDGGQWQHEAMLSADEGQFEGEVAVSGDVIVVGASHDDELGDHAGAAFVLRHDGAEWVPEAKLFASDPDAWDRFGYSVAVEGDLIVIGATEWNTPYWEGLGSAYVFEHLGDQWIEQAKLVASDGQEDDRFGSSVTIEGDTIMILAYKADAVYYFQRVAGAWVEQQKITPPDEYPYADFRRMSHSGDYLVIGDTDDDEAAENAGCAYIYQRIDGTWTLRQKLLAHDAGWYHQFGTAVAISDETAFIGAQGSGPEGWMSAWAYLFRLDGNTWQEVIKLAGDGPLWAGFGISVAIDGDRAVVGAYDDPNDEGRTGSIYLYAGMIGADCNRNGVADGCDIFLGTSEDMNENGIPDECECPGDFDGDWDVDTADLLFLLGAWGTPDGDVDFDGDTDTADLLALLGAWGDCPRQDRDDLPPLR